MLSRTNCFASYSVCIFYNMMVLLLLLRNTMPSIKGQYNESVRIYRGEHRIHGDIQNKKTQRVHLLLLLLLLTSFFHSPLFLSFSRSLSVSSYRHRHLPNGILLLSFISNVECSLRLYAQLNSCAFSSS